MLNGSALWETCWDRLERHWATTRLDSDAFQEARSAGTWLPGAFIIASRAADKSAISSFFVFAMDYSRWCIRVWMFAYLSRGRVVVLTEVRVVGEEMRPP
jgi:hypothetical protein